MTSMVQRKHLSQDLAKKWSDHWVAQGGPPYDLDSGWPVVPWEAPAMEGSERLMIVGEAPGVEEEGALRPFVGRAGNALNTILDNDQLRVDRGELYITNVCKHRPRDEGGKTKAPSTGELAYWLPCLREEILTWDP